VNGEPIVRSGELSSMIGLAAPGEKIKLKVWRDHTPRDVEAKLAQCRWRTRPKWPTRAATCSPGSSASACGR
jgi:hypothetical protein